MGYLSIDHRGGQDIDDKDGRHQEYDTIACGHCGSVIAILVRPHEKLYLANIDIAHATLHGKDLGHEYQGKRPCRRCRKPLCRLCAATGLCQPLAEQFEPLKFSE